VLMGSIGLVGLAREYKLDLTHLNDLKPLSVPPLQRDESIRFVHALVRGGNVLEWTEAHTAALLDESAAFYPSMIQWGFQELTVCGKAARLDRIPELFAEKIRPDLDASFYQQFDRRMQRYKALDEPLPGLLQTLLTRVMSSAEPVPRDALTDGLAAQITDADLGDALSILREDGFLRVREDRNSAQLWRPDSDLVRGWWRHRRGATRK
jgi:hypothetical protein